MKVKTSITLSQDVVRAVDQLAGRDGNRSEVIERAVRAWLSSLDKARRDRRDRELYEKHATSLEREALDVLTYQAKHG